MSRWVEAYDKAGLSELFVETTERISNIDDKDFDQRKRQELSRLKRVLRIVHAFLEKLDPELLTQHHIQGFVEQNNGVVGQLNNFESNGNVQTLVQANTHADEVLAICNRVHLALPKRNVVTQANMKGIIEQIEENIRSMTSSRKQLENELEVLKNEVSQTRDRLAQLDGQVQEKNTWLTEISTQWQSELAEKSARWQTDFSEGQTDRNGKFTESQDEFRAEQRSTIAEFSEATEQQRKEVFAAIDAEIDSLRGKSETELQEILSDGHDRHESIKKIHGLVAEDATSGSYKSASGREGKSSTRWRLTSLGAIILSVVWVGFAFWKNGFGWQTSLSALPVTLVLASAAGYAGKIGAGHRRESLRVRQFAMEMEALQPYLDKLDDAEAKRIRGELAKEYFGKIPEIEPQDSEFPSNSALIKLKDAQKRGDQS